jgi:hypothetical protein
VAGFGPPRDGRVAFTLDGESFELEPPSGAVLAGCLSRGDWWGIVPGMLPEQQQARLIGRVWDDRDPLDLPDVYAVAVGLVDELVGQPYAAALRLCAVAAARWSAFDGWCLAHGFDPQTAPAHRIVSAGRAWLNAPAPDEKTWQRIEAQLYAPLPGHTALAAAVPPRWGTEEEEAGFMALAAATGSLQGSVPAVSALES